MEHYVYKYVCKGQIVYIGKADSGLRRRINEHALEKRFQDLPEPEIFCMKLNNAAETTCMEMLLINKYKPVLNIKDKYPETLSIQFEEPPWIPVEDMLMKVSIDTGADNTHKNYVFWDTVLRSVQDDEACLVISRELIPDNRPLGFITGGIFYPVFTFGFDLGPVSTFVYSSTGLMNAKTYLPKYLEGLRNKEE